MDAMVKMLYEKETIYEDEIDALFGEESDEDSIFSSKVNRGEKSTDVKAVEKAVEKKPEEAESDLKAEVEIKPEGENGDASKQDEKGEDKPE